MSKKTTSASAKAAYQTYANTGRRAKNKAKKIARHIKKHPNDKQATKTGLKFNYMPKALKAKAALEYDEKLKSLGKGE